MKKYPLIAALLLMAGGAMAQEELFASLDSDADGQVSVAEAEKDAIVAENFSDIDADHSDSISEQELMAYVDSVPAVKEEAN